MPRKGPQRVSPAPVNGIVEPDAPFWRGDTAERIVAERVIERANRPRGGRSRAPRSAPSGDPRVRTLRRLERNLPRRKTLAARVRLQQRIEQLRAEIGA